MYSTTLCFTYYLYSEATSLRDQSFFLWSTGDLFRKVAEILLKLIKECLQAKSRLQDYLRHLVTLRILIKRKHFLTVNKNHSICRCNSLFLGENKDTLPIKLHKNVTDILYNLDINMITILLDFSTYISLLVKQLFVIHFNYRSPFAFFLFFFLFIKSSA